jgi:S1-C subfamily serine protease
VNLLDVAIAVALVAAIVGGYRLGFLARLCSWIGLALGAVLALRFSGRIGDALDRSGPQTRFLAATAFFVAVAMIGQGLGLAVGLLLHERIKGSRSVGHRDRVAGGLVGGIGVLLVVWLIAPAMVKVDGWPAREARNSAIVQAVHDLAPPPPDTTSAFGGLVEGDFTGLIASDADDSPTFGPPPAASPLGDAATQRVIESTVKITGRACDRIQEGTGFVADIGLVLTNAHVVAGESRTEVETADGRHLAASVVVFDPRADVAALRVDDIGVNPLPRIDTDDVAATEGVEGAVFGHPNGGDLVIRPARVGRVFLETKGTDIYRREETSRTVLGLASQLEPGDSGAPLVAANGAVVAMAFAIDPHHPDVAYALAMDELVPVIRAAQGLTAPAETSDCLD